jgi:hypothetical protein
MHAAPRVGPQLADNSMAHITGDMFRGKLMRHIPLPVPRRTSSLPGLQPREPSLYTLYEYDICSFRFGGRMAGGYK